MENNYPDFPLLDRPDVLFHLFHPRGEPGFRPATSTREDYLIPVSSEVVIGASLHFWDAAAPFLLFFHGNGEIVADYDDLGPVFARGAGVNFFVADYRGYGTSTGSPGVGSMLRDAAAILAFVEELKQNKGMTGTLNVMGRSLGSAPALDLAARFKDRFESLIIESGFAYVGPLLRILGLAPEALGFREENGMGNLDKVKTVDCPLLVIHAEQDVLIPFSDGQALYDACPSGTKQLLKIKGAGHNDIFFRGLTPYLDHVRRFCGGAGM